MFRVKFVVSILLSGHNINNVYLFWSLLWGFIHIVVNFSYDQAISRWFVENTLNMRQNKCVQASLGSHLYMGSLSGLYSV